MTSTIRGEVGAVTTAGRLIRFPVIDLPVLPESAAKAAPSLSGGAPVSEFVRLEEDERVLCLCSLNPESPGLALGTVQGVVKRVVPDYPKNRDTFEVITLKDGDTLAGATELRTGEEELVFITDDAQLLKYSASLVRPQGCPAGGMAGITLSDDASVIFFGAVDPGRDGLVVSMAGSRRRPGRRRDHDQGDAVRAVPDQGPRHRRRPLPALPEGRAPAGRRVGGERTGVRLHGERDADGAAGGGRAAGRLRGDRWRRRSGS